MLMLALLFAAAFWAGAQNALAGGGSFITLPMLMLSGLDPRAVRRQVLAADDVVEYQPQRNTPARRFHQRLARGSLRHVLCAAAPHRVDLHVADLSLDQRIRHVDRVLLI